MTGKDSSKNKFNIETVVEIAGNGSGNRLLYIDQRKRITKKVVGEFTGRLITETDNCPDLLVQAFIYFMQTGIEIPHRKDWNRLFYQGLYYEVSPREDLREVSQLLYLVKERASVKDIVLLSTQDKKLDYHSCFELRNKSTGKIVYPKLLISEMSSAFFYSADGANGNIGNENVLGEGIPFHEIPCLNFSKHVQVEEYVLNMLKVMKEHSKLRESIGRVYSEFPFQAYERLTRK